MELDYIQCGDYLIPNLAPNSEPEEPLGKYGMMRWEYLRTHVRGIFGGMLLGGTLKGHCLEIQEQAQERLEQLMGQMKEREGLTESLKDTDPLLWAKRMNSIHAAAEETVLSELIYSQAGKERRKGS